MMMTSHFRDVKIEKQRGKSKLHLYVENMQQSLADEIAVTALHHYNHVLPLKGKPKENEWTVYAAIVAVSKRHHTAQSPEIDNNHDGTQRPTAWVVSCATGTKCCAIPQHHHDDTITQCDHILRDSHAEVLARRGLVRVLWNEMIQSVSTPNHHHHKESKNAAKNDNENDHNSASNILKALMVDSTLENTDRGVATFVLRDDVDLHLYVSDSPCGDASIYGITTTATTTNDQPTDRLEHLKFTGSKAIIVNSSYDSVLQPQPPVVSIIRESDQQMLGQLRTKSSRSNIDRHRQSSSMSCSDKLVRWSILGLQGAVLSQYILTPIRFTSIVAGHDPAATTTTPSDVIDSASTTTVPMESTQLVALQRAIPQRVQLVQQYLLDKSAKDSSSSTLPPDNQSGLLLQKYINDITPPHVFTSHHTFERGKAVVEYAASISKRTMSTSSVVAHLSHKRKRSDTTDNGDAHLPSGKVSVTGISINWHQPILTQRAATSNETTVELIVGVRGLRQGKKPKGDDDAQRLQSRLCRNEWRALREQFLTRLGRNDGPLPPQQEAKETHDKIIVPTTTATTTVSDHQPINSTLPIRDQHKMPIDGPYRTIRTEWIFAPDSPLAGWIVGDTTHDCRTNYGTDPPTCPTNQE